MNVDWCWASDIWQIWLHNHCINIRESKSSFKHKAFPKVSDKVFCKYQNSLSFKRGRRISFFFFNFCPRMMSHKWNKQCNFSVCMRKNSFYCEHFPVAVEVAICPGASNNDSFVVNPQWSFCSQRTIVCFWDTYQLCLWWLTSKIMVKAFVFTKCKMDNVKSRLATWNCSRDSCDTNLHKQFNKSKSPLK